LSFNARSPTHPGEESTLTIDGTELEQGLQYGDTAGLKSLLDWIQGLQELNHGRHKDEGWRISIGSGSQDLIYKVNFLSELVVSHDHLKVFICYIRRSMPWLIQANPFLWNLPFTRKQDDLSTLPNPRND
jgi:hypothetical protein